MNINPRFINDENTYEDVIAFTPLPTPYVLGLFKKFGVRNGSVYYYSDGSHRPTWKINYGNRYLSTEILIEALKKILKKRRVWVTNYGSLKALLIIYFAIITRKSMILGPWEIPYEENGWKKLRRKITLYFPMRLAAEVYFCSIGSKNYYSKIYNHDRGEVLYYKALWAEIEDTEKIKDDKRLCIVFSGALTNLRNPLGVVDTLRYLTADERLNIKLVVSGSGPLESIVEEKIKELELGEVVFRKSSDWAQIKYDYSRSDVLLVTNHKSTWNMTIQEALQFGCLVIGTNTTEAVRELISNRENGFVVNDGDYYSMADCVRSLLQDRILLKRIKIKCRQFASETREYLYIEESEYNEYINSDNKL